ncbi:UNVERIFIED_CONTAM: hypothetical protein E7W76_01955 [Cronobacter sakazakii]
MLPRRVAPGLQSWRGYPGGCATLTHPTMLKTGQICRRGLTIRWVRCAYLHYDAENRPDLLAWFDDTVGALRLPTLQ